MHHHPGLGAWPKAITPDYFQKHHGGKIPSGVLRTVVPAAPDAWITALAQLGHDELRRGRLLRDRLRARRLPGLSADVGDHHRARGGVPAVPSNVPIYLPNGRPPRVGEVFVQKDLAATMQYMADEESAAAGKRGRKPGFRPRATRSTRATSPARSSPSRRRTAGSFRRGSCRVSTRMWSRRSRPRSAVSAIRLRTLVPGALTAAGAQSSRGTELKKLGHNTPEYLHRIAEAVKLAFADREAYFGDPRLVDVPIDALLSPEYARERRQLIRSEQAWPEMPPAGDPRKLRAERAPRRAALRAGAPLGRRQSSIPLTSVWSTSRATSSRRRRATAPTTPPSCRVSGSFPHRAAARTGPTRSIRPASHPASARA